MTRRWVCLGACLAAYGAVVTYADPLLFLVLALGCAFIALVTLVCVAACKPSSSIPGVLLLGIIAALVALPINQFIQQKAETAARAYPARVAPFLEQYRSEHGTYPASLNQLPSYPRAPRLLRGDHHYSSDGQQYSFGFSRSLESWHYSSETHTWHLST